MAQVTSETLILDTILLQYKHGQHVALACMVGERQSLIGPITFDQHAIDKLAGCFHKLFPHVFKSAGECAEFFRTRHNLNKVARANLAHQAYPSHMDCDDPPCPAEVEVTDIMILEADDIIAADNDNRKPN